MDAVEYIAGHTWHGRSGELNNTFRYKVDYILIDLDAKQSSPSLFSKTTGTFFGVLTKDYGGASEAGRATAWVRETLQRFGIPADGRILLLGQPRVLGHVFNPVSFWFCYNSHEELIAVISEVTNTFGDRHWYLSHTQNFKPIHANDRLNATKIFHVSPFQPINGTYEFRFDIRPEKIGIWITLKHDHGGVKTNLVGRRKVLTNGAILKSILRRPFGSRRVLGLIHWQALKLWLKGAKYRDRPTPPKLDVSQ